MTSNENKRREVEEILGLRLVATSLEVPEVQSLDFSEVAAAKALAAREALDFPSAPVLVDDSGLAVGAWGGFPGALTKWLMQSVGNEGLLKMLSSETDRRALAVCAVAVILPSGETHLFRGEVPGEVTQEPRGSQGFGFDPVFQPEGQPGDAKLTYAELGEKKSLDSHRTRAFRKAGIWLEDHGDEW